MTMVYLGYWMRIWTFGGRLLYATLVQYRQYYQMYAVDKPRDPPVQVTFLR